MKKRFRKSLAVLLTVVMMLGIVAVAPVNVGAGTVAESSGASSGTTGDCTWAFDYDTLTISGDGYMRNYSVSDDIPWYFRNLIKKIVIENGVCSIGDHAFRDCYNLESISIPNSVTYIGDYSLSGCNHIESISIPKTATYIGSGAFIWCDKLKNVLIPASVKTIGDYAFAGCPSILNITVDSYNTIYDSRNSCNAIMKTDSNTLVVGCKNTNIPEGVVSIGNDAFYYCTSLIGITIPNTVRKIDNGAFFHCDSLEKITIPKSVDSIGDEVFTYCDKVTIYGNGNSRAEEYAINHKIPFVDISSDTTSDTINPTVTLSSTNKVASSQTVIINLSDNIGIKGFYWGTNTNYSDNYYHMWSGSEASVKTSVDASGTYYATAVDISGNVSSTELITFYKTTLNANGGSVNPTSVLTKSGNSFTFPTPTRSNYTCVGWSTSPSATSGVKSLSPSSNTTYYAVWQNSKKSISECTVTLSSSSYYYDGTEKKPTITVKDGSTTLTENTDYTVLYSNNTNVGTATATVTGIGNYGGSVNKSYTISYETISLNAAKTINITTAGSVRYFSYKPSSNISVKFYSTGSSDSYGYIYDSNLAQLSSNDDGGENHNFLVTYDLQANKQYIFSCKMYSSNSTGTFDIKLEQYSADTQKPTVSLSSTNNVASSQTVTISLSDNVGIKGYYLGTSSTYSNNSYTTTSNTSISKTLDTSGTYYATAVDMSGNVSSTVSITFYKTTLNANGGSVSPSSVLTKSGNSFTFPTPTRSNYSYVGWSTSSSASSGVKTLTPSANTTYYAVWKSTDRFVWGRDNLNFNNWAQYYGTKLDNYGNAKFTYRELFTSKYLNKLKQNLTASEYQTIFVRNGNRKSWMDDTWGGSCYGMALVEFLSKEGVIKPSDFSKGAKSINDFSSPVNDKEINSLINYYFMLQIKPNVRSQMDKIPKRSNETNIKNILSLLDSHSVVMVGIENLWHEILAYGYEYGSYTINGVTYNGKIFICDPNRSTDNYATLSDVCLYFNTKSYSWTIPFYERLGYSSRNCAFNHISADVNELNDGGYVGNNNASFPDDYVGRLDAYEVSDNRTITKVSRDNNGSYMNKSSGEGDIEAAYSSMMRGTENRVQGYNLRDTDSAYRLSQPVADRLDLILDYGTCTLTASSAAGKSIVFDNNGYIEVEGDAADYTMEMIYDDSNPTDWFSMRVSGHGAEESSMLMVENGYILSSDNLNDVKLNANNKEFTAEATFSTDYNSVFIYEIDENTIGLKVDTDGNGTYETELSASDETAKIGDTNLDGIINISDVTSIQRYLTKSINFNEDQLAAADTNGDGKVDISDATYLQMYLAKYDVVLGKNSR